MNKLIRIYTLALLILACSGLQSGCRSAKPAGQSAARNAGVAKAAADTGKPCQTVELPVFIPVAELQKRLYDVYFAPGYGKFYPCSGQSDCSSLYKDIYVEEPNMNVQGGLIAVKMHLAGNLNALIFHPGVSGYITLTARPQVSGDTLYFQDVKMENISRNFLLGVASALFEKQIEARIRNKAWFSFRPVLDNYIKDFQKQTPVKWGAATLLLSLKTIDLQRVDVLGAPDNGIIAVFSAILCTEKPSYGK